MKPGKLAFLLGIAALGVSGVVLYKKNLKKIEKEEEKESKEFEELGISDIKEVVETPVKVKDPYYGDIKRFAELPVPHQVLRLLDCSSKWDDDDLDWEEAIYGERGSYNSVHVLFKDTQGQDGFPNNKVGFFIEVPPLIAREKSGNNLKYRDYQILLNRLSVEFWEKHKIECSRPREVECIGLYSYIEKVQDMSGLTANILRYKRIPDDVLRSRAQYNNDRIDGLYRYYSDAKKAFEDDSDILPEEVDDIHLFMGVWFKLECAETNTYGINIKQILQFLEELVINDDYVIEDQFHHNKQTLGPVIVHPRNELEIVLDKQLKEEPITYSSDK